MLRNLVRMVGSVAWFTKTSDVKGVATSDEFLGITLDIDYLQLIR